MGKSNWKWFGVKLLYESVISGQPTPETIDENFSEDLKTYEESIILVKAQSFDHAYKIADRKAKQEEINYHNPYDQLVEWRFLEAIDAFELFDDELKSGTEVYSRFIRIPKDISKVTFVKSFYPETDDDSSPDSNMFFRVREFNKRPGQNDNGGN